MNIECIASGSGGNCYVLASGDHRLLIECGFTWSDVREALAFSTSGLSGILVSHNHMDHAKGAEKALRYGQEVYMSAGTAAKLGLSDHGLHIVEAGVEYEVGRWRVIPFDVDHEDAAEPIGFQIRAPDGDLAVYATDTAALPYKFRGPTHVMIEANYDLDTLRDSYESGRLGDPDSAEPRMRKTRRTHMRLRTLIKTLRHNIDLSRTREIWLLHMSSDNADPVKIVKRVREETGLPVYLAGKEDLL